MKQKTICNKINCRGVGLHSGKSIFVTLKPAPENTGIVFRRVDLDPVVTVAADVFNVGETLLSTCLIKDNVRVSTIEHLMSALSALAIDNLIIDITGPEVPIMDGSSAPFIFLIQSAGIAEQNKNKRAIIVKETIRVDGDNGQFCEFIPSDHVSYHVTTDFDHPHSCFSEENQNMNFKFSFTSYQKEISRARTFGFMSQYNELRKNNLALGGGVHNAIVFDEYHTINKDGLRYDDEPLRHKLLDVIGDLYLAGGQVIAEFRGHKPGHYMNNKLLRALISAENAWEFSDECSTHSDFSASKNRILAT